ncbi:neprilysin-11-like isoform X2 [Prorops nasuta]
MIKSGMDPDTIPCDNFYTHMCKNWKIHNPIKSSKKGVTPSCYMVNTVACRIRAIIQDRAIASKTKALQKVKSLYQMCMDTNTINRVGLKPIFDIIKAIGGWPLIKLGGKHKKINFWQPFHDGVIKIFQPLGLYSLRCAQDLVSSRILRLRITQPPSILPPSMDSDMIRQTPEYLSHRKNVLDILLYATNYNINTDDYFKMIEFVDEMLQLELDLAEISVPPEGIDNTKLNYNLITIKRFQEFYDSHGGLTNTKTRINWLEVIQLQLRPAGVTITENELINVKDLEYFYLLPAVLNKHKSSTIANYVIWLLFRFLFHYSDVRFFNNANKSNRTEVDGISLDPREATCIMHPSLIKAISFEYVTRHFTREAKEKAQILVDHIAKITIEAIKNVKWMDEPTRRMTLEKLESMERLVGYPDEYSTAYIDKYYSEYNLGSSYVASILNLFKFHELKEIAFFKNPDTKSKWQHEPTEVNAFYVQSLNSIVVPAASLQPPFFDAERPEVLNFASIGVIIGHEISHAFDETAYIYDKHGNLGNWMSKEIYDIFKSIIKCFIDQFSQFPIPELINISNKTIMVDGNKTSGENIADSTGAQLAYMAFLDFLIKNGNIDLRLVGLEQYSSKKLFFMQYANLHCSNLSPDGAAHIAAIDTHAPNEIRVIGSIINNIYFAGVFECPKTSYMNSQRKCSIL